MREQEQGLHVPEIRIHSKLHTLVSGTAWGASETRTGCHCVPVTEGVEDGQKHLGGKTSYFKVFLITSLYCIVLWGSVQIARMSGSG